MTLIPADIQQQIHDVLAGLEIPVKLLVFTQGEGGAIECDLCSETRQLVEEVSQQSDKLSVEVLDFVRDAELAEAYQIDKIPAIAVLRGGEEPKDYGIRLYGIPSGYEFSSLIEDILLVSRGKTELKHQTLQELAKIDRPVRIQVFVAPTCPYCPKAVVLAHQLAMASEWITADIVESMEFPHLANRYQVYGVQRTVINDVIHLEGALPEAARLPELMTVLNEQQMQQLQVGMLKPE
jgi:glutaredoxin-like protein